jgi:hypothetical protein
MLASLLAFLSAHAALLATLAGFAVSEIMALRPNSPYNGILQAIQLFLKSKSGAAKAAAILLPLAFLSALPGCAFCKVAANAAVPRCVLEANMISCGEADGFALVPMVLGLIASAIAGSPLSAAAIEALLISQGVKDVPCVLAALEDYLSASDLLRAGDPASGFVLAEVHIALLDALAKKGLHGSVKIKLRNGHVVSAVVP